MREEEEKTALRFAPAGCVSFGPLRYRQSVIPIVIPVASLSAAALLYEYLYCKFQGRQTEFRQWFKIPPLWLCFAPAFFLCVCVCLFSAIASYPRWTRRTFQQIPETAVTQSSVRCLPTTENVKEKSNSDYREKDAVCARSEVGDLFRFRQLLTLILVYEASHDKRFQVS